MGGGLTTGVPIDGVRLEPLRVIGDERGAVLHVLRVDSPWFHGFGEVYVSEILPAVQKGWKRHRRMTQYIAVPSGRVRFAFFDARGDSPTSGETWSCELGRPDAYALLIIPPGLWYAWRGVAAYPSLLVNCADLPHDPLESEQSASPQGLAPFQW